MPAHIVGTYLGTVLPGNTGSAATNVKEDFGNEVLLVIRTGWRKWYLALLHMKKKSAFNHIKDHC